MIEGRPYVGRFAPSPTGRLHLGSMVAAVASWLDARAHGGQWLVRIEDLDPPREVAGAAEDILRTLEGFGLTWDGQVVRQSDRHALYREVLSRLQTSNLAFGCACTRKVLAKVDGLVRYPGTCRAGLPPGVQPRSWRFRMPSGAALNWKDRRQGHQVFDRDEAGDFTLLRADGHWAYHLAVVTDDEAQGVTDVVRGADLVSATACHLALQQALRMNEPRYMHVGLVVNDQGQKLSKQTLAVPVELRDAPSVLQKVMTHLKLGAMERAPLEDMLQEGVARWRKTYLQ